MKAAPAQYTVNGPYKGLKETDSVPPGHLPGLTAFEQRLVMQERQERVDAHDRYAIGLQGRDGGPKPHDPL